MRQILAFRRTSTLSATGGLKTAFCEKKRRTALCADPAAGDAGGCYTRPAVQARRLIVPAMKGTQTRPLEASQWRLTCSQSPANTSPTALLRPTDARADYPLRPWPGHHGFASCFRPDCGGACTHTLTQRGAIVRRGRGLRAASGHEGRESVLLDLGAERVRLQFI